MLKNTCIKLKQLLAVSLILLYGLPAAPVTASDKMSAEEVVAKHLSSIGTAEARASARTRVAMGTAKAITRSNVSRDITGVAQFASDGDKVLLAMIFSLIDYPYEKAGYDGDKVRVALLQNTGARSTLGDFIMSQTSVFREGLIGGALSSAWPLLDTASKKAKLNYAGRETIDGRTAHKLKYHPPKGAGDFQINLFFDAETFRHLRTEYQYVVDNRMGYRPQSSVAVPTDTGNRSFRRYKLIEEFSDFKTENGLTLPHTYKLKLTVDAERPRMLEWVINFSQFIFNQQLDATAFKISASN